MIVFSFWLLLWWFSFVLFVSCVAGLCGSFLVPSFVSGSFAGLVSLFLFLFLVSALLCFVCSFSAGLCPFYKVPFAFQK